MSQLYACAGIEDLLFKPSATALKMSFDIRRLLTCGVFWHAASFDTRPTITIFAQNTLITYSRCDNRRLLILSNPFHTLSLPFSLPPPPHYYNYHTGHYEEINQDLPRPLPTENPPPLHMRIVSNVVWKSYFCLLDPHPHWLIRCRCVQICCVDWVQIWSQI